MILGRIKPATKRQAGRKIVELFVVTDPLLTLSFQRRAYYLKLIVHGQLDNRRDNKFMKRQFSAIERLIEQYHLADKTAYCI